MNEMPEPLPPAVKVPDVRVLRIALHALRLHAHKYYVPGALLSFAGQRSLSPLSPFR